MQPDPSIHTLFMETDFSTTLILQTTTVTVCKCSRMVLDQFHWILILSITYLTVTLTDSEIDLRRQFIKNKINKQYLRENYGKTFLEGDTTYEQSNQLKYTIYYYKGRE